MVQTKMMSDIEGDAIGLIEREKSDWQEMEVNLTDKILFRGKNIIERARKNYFSIFDNLYDSVTNRKKLFVPATRDMVETTVKNIDIDTKDIGVRAKNPDSYLLAVMTRYILASFLTKIRFGQILNRVIRTQSVEGVSVLKKVNEGDKVKINLLENLNFVTDPTANYLIESSGNIEDNWLTTSEAKSHKNWAYLDDIVGTTSMERIPDIINRTQIPYVQITERWGLMPRYLLTGKEKDKEDYLEGIIIVSNLNAGGKVQLIAENKSGQRPYREFRTKVYDGRWLGIGIGEDLFDIQSYMNEIVNTRMNTARIKQLGLFQIRKGSGITPQSLSQLYSGGGIQVSQVGRDIQELRTSDIKPSSYKDEETAYLWAQRMTGAWEIGRGENLPASMPATTAVLQEKGMKSGFSLQQEELGFCISDFIENLLLPALFDTLTEGQMVPIVGDIKELKILDDAMINNSMNAAVIAFKKEFGYYPTRDEIDKMKEQARKVYRKQGNKRWIKIKKKLFSPENLVDSVQVFVTGESFNKMVMVKQLNDLLVTYSNIFASAGLSIDASKIVGEILDLMGLSSERFVKSPEEVAQTQLVQAPGQSGQPGQLPISPVRRPPQQQPVTQETERVAQAGTAERGGAALVPAL